MTTLPPPSSSTPTAQIGDWYRPKYGEFSEDERNAYKQNPLAFALKDIGDFTSFYVAITICTFLALGLIVLNVFLCWCSKHSDYWRDSNTGNRWILPIWTKTPYRQPPLDLTELEETVKRAAPTQVYETQEHDSRRGSEAEYLELHKRESDL